MNYRTPLGRGGSPVSYPPASYPHRIKGEGELMYLPPLESFISSRDDQGFEVAWKIPPTLRQKDRTEYRAGENLYQIRSHYTQTSAFLSNA